MNQLPQLHHFLAELVLVHRLRRDCFAPENAVSKISHRYVELYNLKSTENAIAFSTFATFLKTKKKRGSPMEVCLLYVKRRHGFELRIFKTTFYVFIHIIAIAKTINRSRNTILQEIAVFW